MLVLSRKVGERIVVPQFDLTVTIAAIDGHRVRLAFSAPPEVAVFREELWQRCEQERVANALTGTMQGQSLRPRLSRPLAIAADL
jgi:carbon storage regulator